MKFNQHIKMANVPNCHWIS